MTEHTDGVAANGAPTLTDRVKELRLAGKLDGPRAGGGTAWLPWLLCALLAVGWAGFAIKWYRGAPAKSVDAPADGAAASGSLAARGSTPDDTVALEVKGYLIPTQSISVSPIDVAGRVVRLNFEEGMSFEKGAVLAEIDSTPYRAMHAEQVAAAAAARSRLRELELTLPLGIEQATAELNDAIAALQPASQEWRRVESLSTTALATGDKDKARAAFDSGLSKVKARQAALKSLTDACDFRKAASQAELEAAEARLQQAQWKLDNCVIKSPVTGVILTKKAEVGSLINPVVGGVSTYLCEIADLRKLEVDLEVNERDIRRVRLNQACRVKADAYPDREYEGYVERVMPTANRAKSIVPVRIKVVPREDEKQGQYLKPEMGVTVTFLNRDVTPEFKAEVRRKLADDSAKSVAPK